MRKILEKQRPRQSAIGYLSSVLCLLSSVFCYLVRKLLRGWFLKHINCIGGIRKVPSNGIFNRTISLLERSLDLRSLNQRVLASNIANMDTPNYKAFELVVAEEMKRYAEGGAKIPFERTHANHLPGRTEPLGSSDTQNCQSTGFQPERRWQYRGYRTDHGEFGRKHTALQYRYSTY